MKLYRVLMHGEAFKKAENYLAELVSSGLSDAGNYLKKRLGGINLSAVTAEDFIEHLTATKRPQIFAESAVYGDGTDWNHAELSILGDIGIAADVTVYDDGTHSNPKVHDHPFSATLLYIPGALLRNGTGNVPADWEEVVKNREIDRNGFNALYERRLLPLLLYANEYAAVNKQKALITVPGLGCGQFAGPFKGRMGEHLKHALAAVLEKYSSELASVKAVYYDPYSECSNERIEINKISLIVRPLTMGNYHTPQLCKPAVYQDSKDDFSDCRLFSVVAWDHVSWPGNDFYAGVRATDDGVKAAATSSMLSITGIEGSYNRKVYRYNPPAGFKNWEEVVVKQNLQIEVKGNLGVLPGGISEKPL